MADRKERRFLLLAGLLVLASWAAVGWVAATGRPQLYHTELEEARVVRRLPPEGGRRGLVRLPNGERVEIDLPDHLLPNRWRGAIVCVKRRAYLGGFKTAWRTIAY
jgi:hypothetical protein